jgi:hypothetical protein
MKMVKKLTDSKKQMLKKGNDYFNNDSFWLIAPFKLRDAGTTRSIVMQDNQALMITYASKLHLEIPMYG